MIRRLVVKTVESGEGIKLSEDEGNSFNEPLGIFLGTEFLLNVAFVLVKIYSWRISEILLEDSFMNTWNEDDSEAVEGMQNLHKYISTGDILAAKIFLKEINSRIIKIEFKTTDRERISIYRQGIISQSTGDITNQEDVLKQVFSDVWRGAGIP